MLYVGVSVLGDGVCGAMIGNGPIGIESGGGIPKAGLLLPDLLAILFLLTARPLILGNFVLSLSRSN